MSIAANEMANSVQLSAERAHGVLRMIAEYVTNPTLKDEDEHLYYALEAVCCEVKNIRKAAEDYLNESPDNAINAFTIMSTPKQEV